MDNTIKSLLESQLNKIQNSIDAIPEHIRLAEAQYEITVSGLKAKKIKLNKEKAYIKKLLKKANKEN